jgi:hypothetical protein
MKQILKKINPLLLGTQYTVKEPDASTHIYCDLC